ncbi:B12-binding domain-containing protein, partial [Streptacidiphilus neutrinimicus]|uniref:B12-binding domain-containing protein n=1 Tax=Streptacidiphilus neutrinimicus TaxID=105420 RepID=UPI00157B55FC
GPPRRWTPADIARLEAMCRLTAQGLPPAQAARAAALEQAEQAQRARSGPSPEPQAVEASGLPFRPAPPPGPAPAGLRPRATRAAEPGDDDAARRRHARGLIRAADRLDAPSLQELLESAVDAWGVERAWEDVIAPTLRAAGRRWATVGDSYVEVEHLLSWHVATEL